MALRNFEPSFIKRYCGPSPTDAVRRDGQFVKDQYSLTALFPYEQGYSLAQIAGYLGMKQETVQKSLLEPPRPLVYKPRRGKLTPYKPFIHQRFFQEKCRTSLQILREMQQQGYAGSS